MPEKDNYITGSRKSDYTAFVITLILLLTGSYFLRVYYTVTVAEFDLVYISAEGDREKIDVVLPTKKYGARAISKSPNELLDFIQNRVKKYISRENLYTKYLYRNPGAQLELNIYYSRNSIELNNKRVVVFDQSSSF